jgi:transcriptional regulator NrdR family protein
MTRTIVLKNDFSKEKFDRNKLSKSIESATMRTKFEKYKAKRIADKVSKCVERSIKGTKEIRSSEIRRMVFDELRKEDQKIAEEFKYFRKK